MTKGKNTKRIVALVIVSLLVYGTTRKAAAEEESFEAEKWFDPWKYANRMGDGTLYMTSAGVDKAGLDYEAGTISEDQYLVVRQLIHKIKDEMVGLIIQYKEGFSSEAQSLVTELGGTVLWDNVTSGGHRMQLTILNSAKDALSKSNLIEYVTRDPSFGE